MMDEDTTAGASGVPEWPDLRFGPEQVQGIFPIAPRDRRENAALFAGVIDPAEIKSDDLFYPALLGMIVGDDLDPIREYDHRAMRRGQARKCFGTRALRFLLSRLDPDTPIDDVFDLDEDSFPPVSPEAAILRFYKHLIVDEAVPGDQVEPETETANWIEIRGRIAELTNAMESPDSEAAAALLDLAQDFADACMAAEAEAEVEALTRSAAALTQRRADLQARLDALVPDRGARLPDDANEILLDRVEPVLVAVETTRTRLQDAEAEKRRLADASRAADSADDFDEQEKLLPLRRENHVARKRLCEETGAALRSLADLIGDPAPVPTSTATVDSVSTFDSPASLDSGEPGPTIARQVTAAEAPKTAPVTSDATSPETHSDGAGTTVDPEALLAVATEESDPSVLETGNDDPPDPDATATEAGDDDTPARWGGRTLDETLCLYLEQGETALAYHLAGLAEDRAQPPALPSAVLRALVLAPGIRRPEDMANPAFPEALAQMMSTVQSLPDGADPDALHLLALAALLRPALFDPDAGTRGHVANLPRDGVLEEFAPLIDALAGLSHDMRVSVADLAELAGTERARRLPEAEQNLKNWLEQARLRKTSHRPTFMILHRELEPGGRIGKVIEAALATQPDRKAEARTEAGVRAFVKEFIDDPQAREDFLSAGERESGRPRGDRIEGMAREWYCQRLEEAADHLNDWLEARHDDGLAGRSRNQQVVIRAVGHLRKRLDRVRLLAEPTGTGSRAAAMTGLARAMDDLAELLDGRGVQGRAPRPVDLLEQPLLRLPGGCQPLCQQGERFASERAAQQQRLFDALGRPQEIAVDLRTALDARLKNAAIVPATAILRLLASAGMPEDELRSLQQEIEEALAEARETSLDRVERLRQSLSTLVTLELNAADRVGDALASVTGFAQAIAAKRSGGETSLPALDNERTAGIPADFPDLRAELTRIESFRDDLRERIRVDQRARLEGFTDDPALAASARAILERVEMLDPVTVDDAIADLQAGRAVPVPEAEEGDNFTAFFPDFVDAIAKTHPGRGRVLQAIKERGSLGPLDFGAHEEREARLARELIETWAGAERGLIHNDRAKLKKSIVNLLGLIGFTRAQLGAERELIPGRLRSILANCDIPHADRWFLPPAFGSEANGQYPVLLARAEVREDQLAGELGRIGRDRPSILFMFGRWTVRQRRQLAAILRRERQLALVIDETLLLYLANSRGALLPVIFSCSTPFGWTQPYTTNAGQIPPEMFFGRRAELDMITARQGGGCLIYGGRQLGKSALLNHVRRQRHDPEKGQIALYMDIKPIGGVGTELDQFWQEFSHKLRRSGVLTEDTTKPRDCVDAIATWLDGEPNRRVLVLLDEADNFLAAEHAAGYLNLLRLKNLMEETSWRFKAVFAGLHNVRRMAQAPNSPLPHLGDPICIGPMNLTGPNRAELRRLAVEPMRAAGFDYETPELAWDMLARMNYYPSLVQVFGRSVIETVGRRTQALGDGPRWVLGRDALFEGEAAERIAEQIRERFQWTLDLDLRYELIAKTIALHRLDDAEGEQAVLRTGLSVDRISDLIEPWWPERTDPPRREDLAELLREMADLGVLGRIGDNRFGLRNAHVANMLGQRDKLEEDILNLGEREQEVDYDAAIFHRTLRPARPEERAPLSDRDLNVLFDPKVKGLRLVRASEAVVGPEVADRLAYLAETWHDPDPLPVKLFGGEIGKLRAFVERIGPAGATIVLQLPWDRKVAEWLGRNTRVEGGEIVPIWVIPPGDCTTMQPVPHVFHAGAWREEMLRHWLRDEGLSAAHDLRETREAIMNASGGAPGRLLKMRRLLQRLSHTTVDDARHELAAWADQNPLPLTDIGVPGDLEGAIRDLAEFEKVETAEDLQVLLGGDAAETVSRLCAHGLARPLGRGGLRVTALGQLVAR